jgi:Kef-type K+ transport system membrane component KefB
LGDVSFNGVAIVAAVALGAPLVLGLLPKLRLPAIVLEIVLGIAIGPQVLGWVSIDTPIQVLSLLGLAFLLLLAGLEVEYDRFRGRPLRLTALGYAISFGLALLIGLGLSAGGLVKSPLLVAIVLSATSLGIVIPVLKDAGLVGTQFGQLVVAVGIAVLGAEHSLRISATLVRLQDTTAEIRIRAAFLLLAVFVVLAEQLELEAILGAFFAARSSSSSTATGR